MECGCAGLCSLDGFRPTPLGSPDEGHPDEPSAAYADVDPALAVIAHNRKTGPISFDRPKDAALSSGLLQCLKLSSASKSPSHLAACAGAARRYAISCEWQGRLRRRSRQSEKRKDLPCNESRLLREGQVQPFLLTAPSSHDANHRHYDERCRPRSSQHYAVPRTVISGSVSHAQPRFPLETASRCSSEAQARGLTVGQPSGT